MFEIFLVSPFSFVLTVTMNHLLQIIAMKSPLILQTCYCRIDLSLKLAACGGVNPVWTDCVSF